MNNFFINAVANLEIEDPFIEDEDNFYLGGIPRSLKKFENHPSVLEIRKTYNVSECFSFDNTQVCETERIINRLNKRSATPYNDIPAKVLEKNGDIVSPFITKIYENAKKDCIFPSPLKTGNITPVHKKGERTNKENYRPISLLPTVSKIYERNMHDQIQNYMEKYFSPFLCGFRKGFGTQHCLAVMAEQWRKAINTLRDR